MFLIEQLNVLLPTFNEKEIKELIQRNRKNARMAYYRLGTERIIEILNDFYTQEDDPNPITGEYNYIIGDYEITELKKSLGHSPDCLLSVIYLEDTRTYSVKISDKNKKISSRYSLLVNDELWNLHELMFVSVKNIDSMKIIDFIKSFNIYGFNNKENFKIVDNSYSVFRDGGSWKATFEGDIIKLYIHSKIVNINTREFDISIKIEKKYTTFTKENTR
jgi:hypothetical protein